METLIGRVEVVPVTPPMRNPTRLGGRHERQLAKRVGLRQFGVNHITLEPGATTSLRHWHEGEDEFVYVLRGAVTLVDDNGEHELAAGAFAGFPAGAPNAHQLTNRTAASAELLVAGTRKVGEERIHYPDEPEPGPFTVLRDADGDRLPPQ